MGASTFYTLAEAPAVMFEVRDFLQLPEFKRGSDAHADDIIPLIAALTDDERVRRLQWINSLALATKA